MAEKTAAEKMRLKPGMTAAILHAPPGVVEGLGLPDDVTVVGQPETAAFILTFAATQAEAEERVREIAPHVGPDTLAWIAYPKGSQGRRPRSQPRHDLGVRAHHRPHPRHEHRRRRDLVGAAPAPGEVAARQREIAAGAALAAPAASSGDVAIAQWPTAIGATILPHP